MSCSIKVLWAMYTYTFAYSETLKCGILPKRQNKKKSRWFLLPKGDAKHPPHPLQVFEPHQYPMWYTVQFLQKIYYLFAYLKLLF